MRKLFTLLVTSVLVFSAACSNGANTAGTGNEEKSTAEATNAAKPSDGNAKKPRVAFVYLGAPGDGGWTYEHDQGRKQMEQELGITATTVENVPEGADAERVFEELAQDHDIIFGTSFGYMDSIYNVAQKHPDVKFLHASGYKTLDNMGTYLGKEYQSAYLVGMAAGQMTKNNHVGYVGAYPIPEVIYTINAFALGAQSVNPDVQVDVVWSNTWFNPATERQAATSLLDAGVDVLAAYQDSPASLQTAAERGVWGIGNDSDMGRFAPDYYISNPVWIWGPYYIQTVKAIMDGTWKPEQYFGSMKDGVTDIAPFGKNVPQAVKDTVEAKKKEILADSFDVFNGPIADQSGVEKVPQGQSMNVEEILNMTWFVKGIKGTIPQ